MAKRYWVCRTDKSEKGYIYEKLIEGELRQGWGSDDGQDLRLLKVDDGARKNLRMLHVKAGDLVLLPHIPKYRMIGVARARLGWREAYQFAESSRTGDHRHTFPVEFIKTFSLHSKEVSGDMRKTMRNPGRFWNVDHLAENIERLLSLPEEELAKSIGVGTRIEGAWDSVFREHFSNGGNAFATSIFDQFIKQFDAAEWEYVLVDTFQRLFPHYVVERVGGKAEFHHGADLTITMPGIFEGDSYVIAVQVKDYSGHTDRYAVDQIQKADKHFEQEGNGKLIEKWVIYTDIDRSAHRFDDTYENTRIFYRADLRRLLTQAGFGIMADMFKEDS